jgi:dienelactone hydrolase
MKLGSRLGGAVDDIILRTVYRRFRKARAPSQLPRGPEPVDRRALLAEAIAFYSRPELEFFPAPPEIRPVEEKRGGLPNGGRIVDLKWPSPFVPHWELLRDEYLAYERNRFGHARLYEQPQPANSIICLHGYRGGPYFLEERAFPVRWLYSLGLNVALFQLPFHAHRGGPDAPIWPSVHVARTNEGFAHAIHDLRALIALLRRRGEVGVTGMSLGGYTTSLTATVEPLAIAAPMIPVASFPDVMWQMGAGTPDRERAEREGITLEMLREAMAVHTPLRRKPAVPPERVLVLSMEGDRIAPPEHATRLAKHFGAEELRFAGGHILQLGRGDAFRALARRMAAVGLISRR